MRIPPLPLASHDQVYPPGEDSRLLAASMPEVTGPCADVGTGSGFLACAMAGSGGEVLATDVNPHALRLARENAAAHGVPVAVVRADLLRGVRRRFRHIAFNPPYVRGGRGEAWIERAWADDGTAARFLREAPAWLLPGGEVHLVLAATDAASMAVIDRAYEVLARTSRRLFFEELLAYRLRPRDELRDALGGVAVPEADPLRP